MAKLKLIQQAFEIRYERGYRYLDRAGEVMLILEEMLPAETGRTWMQEEITPAAARLKCPEMDLRVIFHSSSLVVDQAPATEDFLLSDLAPMIYAVLASRFDIRIVVRMGCRRFFLNPTDSIEDAEVMSVKLVDPPARAGVASVDAALMPRSYERTDVFESADGASGFRVNVKHWERPEAPEQIDERLKLPARLLHTGQREAVRQQLIRHRQREKTPLSGLMADVDYYTIRPSAPNVREFLSTASAETLRLAEAYAAAKG